MKLSFNECLRQLHLRGVDLDKIPEYKHYFNIDDPSYTITLQNFLNDLKELLKIDTVLVEQPEVKIEENKSSSSELSDIETIEKLKNLKDEGLITQEEFERAKGEVLNKK